MTIQEVKAKQAELIGAMSKLIFEFERDTDVAIDTIELERSDRHGPSEAIIHRYKSYLHVKLRWE